MSRPTFKFKIAVIGLMIANCVSLNFNLHPIVFICLSLNPGCLVDLGRSLRKVQSLSIQLLPLKLLAMTGLAMLIRMQATHSEEEEELAPKKKRLPRHVLQ